MDIEMGEMERFSGLCAVGSRFIWKLKSSRPEVIPGGQMTFIHTLCCRHDFSIHSIFLHRFVLQRFSLYRIHRKQTFPACSRPSAPFPVYPYIPIFTTLSPPLGKNMPALAVHVRREKNTTNGFLEQQGDLNTEAAGKRVRPARVALRPVGKAPLW